MPFYGRAATRKQAADLQSTWNPRYFIPYPSIPLVLIQNTLIITLIIPILRTVWYFDTQIAPQLEQREKGSESERDSVRESPHDLHLRICQVQVQMNLGRQWNLAVGSIHSFLSVLCTLYTSFSRSHDHRNYEQWVARQADVQLPTTVRWELLYTPYSLLTLHNRMIPPQRWIPFITRLSDRPQEAFLFVLVSLPSCQGYATRTRLGRNKDLNRGPQSPSQQDSHLHTTVSICICGCARKGGSYTLFVPRECRRSDFLPKWPVAFLYKVLSMCGVSGDPQPSNLFNPWSLLLHPIIRFPNGKRNQNVMGVAWCWW